MFFRSARVAVFREIVLYRCDAASPQIHPGHPTGYGAEQFIGDRSCFFGRLRKAVCPAAANQNGFLSGLDLRAPGVHHDLIHAHTACHRRGLSVDGRRASVGQRPGIAVGVTAAERCDSGRAFRDIRPAISDSGPRRHFFHVTHDGFQTHNRPQSRNPQIAAGVLAV